MVVWRITPRRLKAVARHWIIVLSRPLKAWPIALVAVMPHPAGAHVPAEQLTQEVPDGYD
jgi:hypothetical protein